MAYLFLNSYDVDAGCVLSLNSDFGNPSPVYIKNNQFLIPNLTDRVSLRSGEFMVVACPGSRNHIVLGNETGNGRQFDVLDAKCVEKTSFLLGGWRGEFRNVTCKTQPWTTVYDTKKSCHLNSKLYRIGYEIQKAFYSLYEACFDLSEMKTHYVTHVLTPFTTLQSYRRTQFLDGGVFDNVPISKLYLKRNQMEIMERILGTNSTELYNKRQALTRGHLAPRADFPLRAQMRATFQYINTAPQWRTINSGDWGALESALRKKVVQLGHSVTVYTGTHGVLALPNRDGALQSIYLHFDENNNGVVPVPMYFYKVVYDPTARTAVAFVTINSAFYNKTTTDELQFCSDICDSNPQYSWLTWRSRDGAHSFCCDYTEFANEVKLVKLDVRGRFY